MFIFDNVCPTDIIKSYKEIISNHYTSMIDQNQDPIAWYPTRNIQLKKNCDIGLFVQEFLESKLRIKTVCYDIELQTWPIGSCSNLHKHRGYDREKGDFNSMLYLNDNFNGGEFYTSTGIEIKPKTNRLTFFDGRNIPHGVKEVRDDRRYSIIFWWKNTNFY